MALKKLAQSLRKNQTSAEQKLWTLLRDRRLAGAKFRRQQPLGPYIADFLCIGRRLILEIDGGQHLESQEDVKRTRFMESLGFCVLRFWNHDVLKDPSAVLSRVWRVVQGRPPHPGPLPRGEGKSTALIDKLRGSA